MKKTVKAIGIMAFILVFGVGVGGCNTDSDYGQIEGEAPATMETYLPPVTENNEIADPVGETDKICDIANDAVTQPSSNYTSTECIDESFPEYSDATNAQDYWDSDGVIIGV